MNFLSELHGEQQPQEEKSGEKVKINVYSLLYAIVIGNWHVRSYQTREERTKDRVLYEPLKIVVGPLQDYELKEFVVKSRKVFEWSFLPSLVWFIRGISYSNEISAAWRDNAVNRPRVTCMVAGVDIISGNIAAERSLRDTKMARVVF